MFYGGQGDDTIVGFEAWGDSMVGGTGRNLFGANDVLTPPFFSANDMITVEDYATSNAKNDFVSMSAFYGTQTNDVNACFTSPANGIQAMHQATATREESRAKVDDRQPRVAGVAQGTAGSVFHDRC